MSDDEDSDGTPIEVAAARLLRRWAKANGKQRKRRVSIPDYARVNELVAQYGPDRITWAGQLPFDAETGVQLTRRSSRWHGPFVREQRAGFVRVNDGVTFAGDMARALDGVPEARGGRLHGAAVVGRQVDRRLAEQRAAVDAWRDALQSVNAA